MQYVPSQVLAPFLSCAELRKLMRTSHLCRRKWTQIHDERCLYRSDALFFLRRNFPNRFASVKQVIWDSAITPTTPLSLPENLTFLHFWADFNSRLPRLPPHLKELRFGYSFDQPITSDIFPDSLLRLGFGNAFNQRLCRLPSRLTHLYLGHDFDQPLESGILPSSLKELFIGTCFDRIIYPGVLPAELSLLHFVSQSQFDQSLIPNSLPSNLHTLHLGRVYDLALFPGILPPRLRELTFGNFFDKPIEIATLPTNLRSLTFGEDFNQPLHEIPSCLTELEFGSNFNQPFPPGTLPLSLRVLVFGEQFRQSLPANVLPARLRKLALPIAYQQASLMQKVILPSCLVHLSLGAARRTRCRIPCSLTELTLSDTTFQFKKKREKRKRGK
jgi:hypothetical protein